ncbi:IS110 family transposase [Adlercreutzia sp. ZJ473]|uniref:IS110 family transposase n=1 Tax=Adlercreutzia sp. ZJ473 TaxID=2722822 RepID=UPI001554100E|nr:IS110 family transposase [Adlercreutzia sp. ZJ473]
MQYIGIDVAKNAHVVASRMADGTPHGKAFQFANDERGFRSLLDRFAELGVERNDCIVAMESTGHYWLALWSFLDDHGYPVAVVNPVMTDAFRKADSVRKTKTDAIDALLIAEYARFKSLGPTPIAPEVADSAKILTRYRAHLVAERTALKNRAAAAADRVFPELEGCFSSKHSATSRAVLAEFGTPARVAATDIRTLTRVIREASHGRHGREKAEEVKAAAKASVGSVWATDALAFELAHITALIDHMDEEIAALDAKIAEIVAGPMADLLRTIPGIGPVNAAVILAEVGDPARFGGPSKLYAYAGIDASKFQSGKFDGTEQHMSKRGSSYLRYALMVSADKARMRDPYFGDYYDSLRARGKHHYVAVSGVARKLCGVILAVMKERRPYERRPSVQAQQKELTSS